MKKWIFLIAILLVAAGLRIVLLDRRPAGFTWDEAALGYNAYSLLKTGRDEYGKVLPIVLKSFGDYKPGLYAYFTVPSVAVLGLNEFATRLPSAIFGTLLIVVVYLLTRNIFASLLLAIMPWAVHFSRGAWEANVALTLTTIATLLFIRRRYLFSALFFGLTILTYQGAKMFTPLLLLSLFFIYRPSIKLVTKPLILLFFLALPIFLGFSTQSGRLKVFSVFSYRRNTETVNEIIRQDQNNKLLFWLFHSEIIDQGRGVVQRYLNHLSPYYLFIAGDWQNLRHSIPYYGYLHIPEILTIIVGFIVLLRTNNQLTKLLVAWLLLAPLPAAFSRDLVSGVRSLPMVIPLVIISGIGLSRLLKKRLLFLIYLIVLLFFFGYYLDLNFKHSPYFTSQQWLYPYKSAIQTVAKYQNEYDHIIFTSSLGQPYIFVLFYDQIDPRLYQSQSHLIDSPQGDVGEVSKFGKYVFKKVDWPAERDMTSTLFVGDKYELPEQDMNPVNIVRLGEIYYPDGSHALRVVGLK